MVVSKIELPQSNTIALFFGLGLIGNTFYELIHKKYTCQDFTLPFQWDQLDSTSTEVEAILQQSLSLIDESSQKIDLFWTAGKGGFDASAESLQQELLKFTSASTKLIQTFSNTCSQPLSFHFISSAGGLFEGQSFIHDTSFPSPIRPYGHLKLAQEQHLQGLAKDCMVHIYRPSTVYGYQKNGRSGLINKIISDAIQGKTVEIFASINALRDYILVEDIARFLHHQLLQATPTEPFNYYFLISGKPSPIFEIIQAVKKVVRKSIFTHYPSEKHNSLDITFSRNLIPKALNITPLAEGIALTFRKMRIKH